MIRNQIKNGLFHGVVFFLTVGFLSFTYATINNIWTNTSELEVTNESTLTADNWNKLLGNFEFLKSKTENISSNGGNVGIGIENPSEKLDLGGGNIKMGYQIISNIIPQGSVNGRYYATCPSGQYVLGGSCTTANGGFSTNTDVTGTQYGCYKTSVTDYQIKAICANIR